jgi:hypothetical protein
MNYVLRILEIGGVYLLSSVPGVVYALTFIRGQRRALTASRDEAFALLSQQTELIEELQERAKPAMEMSRLIEDQNDLLAANDKTMEVLQLQRDFLVVLLGANKAGRLSRSVADILYKLAPARAENAQLRSQLKAATEEIAALKADAERRAQLGNDAARRKAPKDWALEKAQLEAEINRLKSTARIAEHAVKSAEGRAALAELAAKSARAKNGKLRAFIARANVAAAADVGQILADATLEAGKSDDALDMSGDRAGAAISAPGRDAPNGAIIWRLNGKMVTVPLPKNFNEMAGWVKAHVQHKVILTPKALRAARDAADFEDVPLVYKSLLLLATRQEMIGNGNPVLKSFYDEQRMLLRVAVEPSGHRTVPLSVRGQYQAEIDGIRYPLDMAIKGADVRDPRKCLRVYFTIDERQRRIVVGHLPAHLDNNLK